MANISRRNFITGSVGAGLALVTGCYKDNTFIPVENTLDDYLLFYTPEVESLNPEDKGIDRLVSDMSQDAVQLSPMYSKNEDYYRIRQDNDLRLASSGTGIIGDVNNDGAVNIFDLLELLYVLSGKKPASSASDVDRNGKTNIFDLLEILRIISGYYDKYHIKGQHINNYTELGRKAKITIDDKVYYTDANGNFRISLYKKPSYTLAIRQIDEDGNPSGFIRTKTIPGENIDNLMLYSVGYPTTISAETFRAFIEEGNTRDSGDNNKDMIKFYNEGNMKYIITMNSIYGEEYNLTSEEQDFIESVIREKIFDVLGFEMPIEKKDASYTPPPRTKPGPCPERRNMIHISGSDHYSCGTEFTEDKYTIIEGNIEIRKVSIKYIPGIIKECICPIFMPFEVQYSISKYKAAYHRYGRLSDLQEVDKIAYKLCKSFRGEHIDNVLVIEEE